MKSIITTYPDFATLPRGVKAMLLFSESCFFQDAKSSPMKLRNNLLPTSAALNLRRVSCFGQRWSAFDAG